MLALNTPLGQVVTVGALQVLNKVDSAVGGLAVLAYEEVGPAGSGIQRSVFINAVVSQGSDDRVKVGVDTVSIIILAVGLVSQGGIIGRGEYAAAADYLEELLGLVGVGTRLFINCSQPLKPGSDRPIKAFSSS